MKIPFWKKCLSYITDVHLESHSSEINPALHLLLVKGRLQLCTDNSIYSFEDQYENFYKVFEKMISASWHYSSVLILGFAMGSIPKMLEDNFKLDLEYTGIEIDDVIIDLVSDYVLSQLHSPIQLINTDAAIFIDTNQDTYDLICVDLFLDNVIPNQFQRFDFIKQLKSKLKPNGCVLYNMLGDYQKDKLNAEKYHQSIFSKVFPNSTLYHTGTNYIMISDRKAIEGMGNGKQGVGN